MSDPLQATLRIGASGLQAQSLRHAEAFHARALQFSVEIAPLARVAVPFVPDTNLLCLALNPAGNSDPVRAAALVASVHAALSCDPALPVQRNEFFGSTTTLHAGLVGRDTMDAIYATLGLLRGGSDDALPVLRHTLMNPWLIDHENGISYIERYFQHLGQLIAAACAATAA